MFTHPTSGERLDLRSPLPGDLRAVLLALAELPDLIAHPHPLEYLGFYRVDG